MRSVLLLSFALLPTAALAQARTISTVAPETTMTAAISGAPHSAIRSAAATHIRETIRTSVSAVQLDTDNATTSFTFGSPTVQTEPKLVHFANIPVTAGELSKPETSVELSMLVDRNGTPINISVERSGGAEVDTAVLSAVKDFRFTAATEEHVPVEKQMTMTITLKK